MSALDRYLRGTPASDVDALVESLRGMLPAPQVLRCVAAGILAMANAVVQDGASGTDIPEIALEAAQEALAGRITLDELGIRIAELNRDRVYAEHARRGDRGSLWWCMQFSLDGWVRWAPEASAEWHQRCAVRDLMCRAVGTTQAALGEPPTMRWRVEEEAREAVNSARHYWRVRFAKVGRLDESQSQQYLAIALEHFRRGIEAYLAEIP